MALYVDDLTVTGTATIASTTVTTVNATTVNAPTINAGANAVAGTINVFPATTLSGKTAITAANNAGNTTTTITTAAQAGARTYTVPDAGASASFVMGVAGVVSIGLSGTAGEVDIFPATLARGKTALTAANNTGDTTTTITTAAQAGARTYTIPDKGASGTFMMTTATLGTTGLPPMTLPPVQFKNVDGTTLAASASAGNFGLTYTPGTAEYLLTEAANSNTKTDVAAIDVVLPPVYKAATDITVTAHCNYVLGGGTVGVHTLAAAAYLNTAAGVQGTTLIATAAQTVPAADGAVTFTITGATLVPGSLLTLTFTLVIEDSGGSNITARVNSVVLT